MIQDRIRDWLVSTLETEVGPPAAKKYVIIVAASICGGYVFGVSGSWLAAIRWDLFAMFILWLMGRISEAIGEYIVKAVLWLLPLATIHPNTGERL